MLAIYMAILYNVESCKEAYAIPHKIPHRNTCLFDTVVEATILVVGLNTFFSHM